LTGQREEGSVRGGECSTAGDSSCSEVTWSDGDTGRDSVNETSTK